ESSERRSQFKQQAGHQDNNNNKLQSVQVYKWSSARQPLWVQSPGCYVAEGGEFSILTAWCMKLLIITVRHAAAMQLLFLLQGLLGTILYTTHAVNPILTTVIQVVDSNSGSEAATSQLASTNSPAPSTLSTAPNLTTLMPSTVDRQTQEPSTALSLPDGNSSNITTDVTTPETSSSSSSAVPAGSILRMSTATATVTEVHMPVTDTFLPSAGTDNKEFTVTTETETVIQSSGIPGYFPTTVTANGPASTQPPETEHTNTPWPQSTTSTSPTDISSSSSQSSITTHQTPNRETLTTENESTNSPTLLTDKLVPESSLSSHLTSGSVSVEMLTTTTKVHHSTSTSASNTPPSSASASATPTPSSSSTPQSTPTSSLHTTTKSIATVLTENKTLIVPGTEHTTDHTITTPVSAMPLSYEASQSTSPEPNITTSSHLTTVSNSSLPLSATTATTIPTTKSVTSPSILNTSGLTYVSTLQSTSTLAHETSQDTLTSLSMTSAPAILPSTQRSSTATSSADTHASTSLQDLINET
ncbi:hypothetical protein AALO_G00301350, partial [Alosa alosa]